MKNLFIKFTSILLAFILVFAVGCNNDGGQDNDNTNPTQYVLNEDGSPVMLVQNRTSDYQIVIPDQAHNIEITAAEELNKYIFESSKCNLPIVKESTITVDDNSKIISVGNTDVLTESGLNVNYSVLGDDGLSIGTYGKKVVLAGATPVGTLYAVYEFLAYVIGFEAYAVDEIVFNKSSDIKLVAFDNYSSIPAIQHRSPTYGDIANAEDAKVLRLTSTKSLYGNDWGVSAHSIEWFVTQNDRPDWFNNGQLCLSNEEAMEFIANGLISKLGASPESRFWEIGHADTSLACTCDKCTESAEIYGGNAGLFVQWLNKVGEKVENWQIENNIDREIWIIGLMYHAYQKAPAKQNSDGSYSPIDDSVKCRSNVAIRYAPINACFAHDIDDYSCPINARGKYDQEILKWKACSDRVYLWLYCTEYYDYAFFMNDYGSLQGSYKFYEEVGVYSIKDEMHQCKRSPFSSLKLYLRSKLMWDPDLDMNVLMDNFFTNYYKEAAPYMREYFNAIRAHFVTMSLPSAQGGYTTDGTHGCYTFNSGHGMVYYDSVYWSMELLSNYQKIVEKAYKALQDAGYTGEEYEEMRLRVRTDEMFITHYYVNAYSSYFTAEEFKVLKQAYVDDFTKLGMIAWYGMPAL